MRWKKDNFLRQLLFLEIVSVRKIKNKLLIPMVFQSKNLKFTAAERTMNIRYIIRRVVSEVSCFVGNPIV